MTVDEVVAELDHVRRTGRGWIARCPAHEDRTPSLSVCEGDDGRVLVKCFAGCTVAKVTAALGLRVSDLFPGPPLDWSQFTPRTPEERRAAEVQRLRRDVRMLELERRRYERALHRACLLVAIAYSDRWEDVLDRLWQGAVDQLERQAAEAADAFGRTEAA